MDFDRTKAIADYIALETLWFSAADDLGKDGNIGLYLQQVLDDSDERVSELAAKSLAGFDLLGVAPQ